NFGRAGADRLGGTVDREQPRGHAVREPGVGTRRGEGELEPAVAPGELGLPARVRVGEGALDEGDVLERDPGGERVLGGGGARERAARGWECARFGRGG